MITSTETGRLIIHVMEEPIDESAMDSVRDMAGSDPIIIDLSQAKSCFEIEKIIAEQSGHRSIVICNLLVKYGDLRLKD